MAQNTTAPPLTPGGNTADLPPPSYAPVDGIQPAASASPSTPTHHTQTDPNDLPFKPYIDGSSVPVLQSSDSNNDLETGSPSNGTRPKRSGLGKLFRGAYTSTKNKIGRSFACIIFAAIILVALAAIGGIIFGFTVATERGLTGEDFWSPGHNSLFRICESDSTSSKPFQLHTCNVFRPNSDLEARPIHSFVENVRSWSTGSGSKLSGQARRIDPVRLDALLLTYGLKCQVPQGVTPPPKTEDVQLIIGGVGQGFDRKKHATACNYWADGTLKQDSCARYNDGGVRAIGKTHPLGINAIMRTHFGMTCEWVA